MTGSVRDIAFLAQQINLNIIVAYCFLDTEEFTIYLGADDSNEYFTKYNFILEEHAENRLHVIDDHFRLADLFVNFKPMGSEYLSRVYIIRYESLHSLNKILSTTVAVSIIVLSRQNDSKSDKLARVNLNGWRIVCPANIPKSMMIEDVLYDPSINETSFIAIENGITTFQPKSQVVFSNLNFKIFDDTHYIWYTSRE
ncbi:hypothetical protein RF11_00978 [Thelohanellus kitauei]|uniref:Uncharacterized protein n=1 Tax=Thelohanellus kitauei TaxID=669202 RepID=A0A0C2INL1_THEKT|nr:hypothetical protein RF11_00978 [Thelohanellus kitauei]